MKRRCFLDQHDHILTLCLCFVLINLSEYALVDGDQEEEKNDEAIIMPSHSDHMYPLEI